MVNRQRDDARTSGVAWLTAPNVRLLDAMLGQLPPDHSQLPPAGDRVVVQVLVDGQWQVHVYDGNQLPPEATDVLKFLAKPSDKLF